MSQQIRSTNSQHLLTPTHTYRPIAPSLGPSCPIKPSPEISEQNKRKWSSTQPDPSSTDHSTNRRNSTSSQGSNTSTTPAIDQRKRRKEQNRAAQRAFRERKERYVKELEDKIKEIEAAHKVEVTQLKEEIAKLLKLKNEREQQQQQSNVMVSPTVTEGDRSPVTDYILTPRISSSAVACIRDKDGVSFCERLKEEVCSNAFDQLLTEPLFDSHGFLNETLASHPVPIVTSEKSRFEKFNELEQTLNNNSFPLQEPGTVDLISCSTVWSRMENHPLFEKFDLDELCNELKKKAKCSKTGPVFEEYEVQEVLDKMEEKVRTNQEQPPSL